MKRALLLAVLALPLAACAPTLVPGPREVLATVQGESGAAFVRAGSAAVRVVNTSGEAFGGDPGRPGDGPALLVEGTPGLAPGAEAAAWCAPRARPGWWGCVLPSVAPGAHLDVVFTGGAVLDASLTYYRASKGARPILLYLGESPK